MQGAKGSIPFTSTNIFLTVGATFEVLSGSFVAGEFTNLLITDKQVISTESLNLLL